MEQPVTCTDWKVILLGNSNHHFLDQTQTHTKLHRDKIRIYVKQKRYKKANTRSKATQNCIGKEQPPTPHLNPYGAGPETGGNRKYEPIQNGTRKQEHSHQFRILSKLQIRLRTNWTERQYEAVTRPIPPTIATKGQHDLSCTRQPPLSRRNTLTQSSGSPVTQSAQPSIGGVV